MPSDELPALQSLLPHEIARRFGDVELAEARKITSLAHRSYELPPHAPAGVRRASYERVRAGTRLPRLTVIERVASQLDPFVKYAVASPSGGVVEAVRIPLERPGRYSACVSSQIGCGLSCAFCATGKMGLVRNLEAWEIVEQVRVLSAELGAGERIHGVVFQGMGEALANFAEVVRAIRVFSEPSALAIDARAVTVCTAGLPEGIRMLAREAPNVRLAISLGSGRPSVRSALMPIDRRFPLREVLAAAAEHARATGYVPLWAYTLLPGVNDTEEDAAALADLFHAFVRDVGVRPRLTLIAYNPIEAGEASGSFRRARPDEDERFWAALAALGVRAKRRYSGGADVGAACGQLASSTTGGRRREEPRASAEVHERSGLGADDEGQPGRLARLTLRARDI